MRILILGAGPAGITVAEELRRLEAHPDRRSPRLRITLVSSEPFPPYSPPAMADHFANRRDAPLFWKGQDVAERLGIDYVCGTAATRVSATDQRVTLSDGRELEYDQLVIATGSRLYAPIEGNDLPGLHDFKSLIAAERLIAHVRRKEVSSAAIVGGGFIGVEVALLLADLGLDVTLIQRRWVMARMLDLEMADIVDEVLEDRGVTVRLFTPVRGFVGEDRVEGVRLESGQTVEADAYIAATGVKPNVEYLEGSDLDVGWGVFVDDGLCTSFPNVWAAGDVAETRDRMTGLRYVHAIFPNAVAQARVVAARMLGDRREYEGAEAMNSMRHLGIPLIAGGRTSPEQIRWRDRDSLRKVFLEDDRIVGYQLAGDISGAGYLRSLMLRGTRIVEASHRLVDPRFAKRDIAERAQPTRVVVPA